MGIDKTKLLGLVDSYAGYLSTKGRTHASCLTYQNPIRKLMDFLLEKGISDPKQITKEHLLDFQKHLYDERDFMESTVYTFTKYLNVFFDYLVETGAFRENIARQVEVLPKPTLPVKQLAHFYTYDEVLRRYLGDQERWVSYNYLNQVQKHIKGFFKYLIANEIGSVYPVTEGHIIRYREFLWNEFVHTQKDALVPRSQIHRLRCIVRLFEYLQKEGILKNNPTFNLGWEAYYKELIEKANSLPDKPETQIILTELDKLLFKFLEYQVAIGKNKNTVKLYKKSIDIFYEYLAKKGIDNVAQVNKRLILEYYTYLCNYVGVRGTAASNGYKRQILWGMRLFFRFLIRFDYLAKDPSLDLENIREERGLPRTCMNEKEVFTLLDKPYLSRSPLVIRDKAIMEFLFSSGLRSHELCSLDIEDVDYKTEMVRVNNPKGGRRHQRVVPIGKIALEYLNLYLTDARPQLENGDGKALFISYSGQRLRKGAVLNLVKKYVHECGFRKNITVHSFRVTCATLMLKNGADIRYVQEQLGHKRITSTQLYTRLAPVDLKGVHQRCHPRERRALLTTPPVKEGLLPSGIDNRI